MRYNRRGWDTVAHIDRSLRHAEGVPDRKVLKAD